MASSLKEAWLTTPPAVTALTVTGLATLANNASAISNAIDNWNAGANAFLDGLFALQVTSGAAGVLSTGSLDIFLQPSLDNVNFADSVNDLYVDTCQIQAVSTPYKLIFSVAKTLQWAPPYWKLRFFNRSGAALAAGVVNYNLPYNTVG